MPILRLLAEIWAVPWVQKVGLSLDGAEVLVWLFVPHDDREAEAKIWAAERAYLAAMPPHGFGLQIIPNDGAQDAILPQFVTVLER